MQSRMSRMLIYDMIKELLYMKTRGFTLVELLVVLGVLAILAVVVVLILDPAKIFQQARDARRIEDLRAVASAIRLGGLTQLPVGEEEIVYISLPDNESASCSSLALQPLDVPFTYRCTPEGLLIETNGEGWIPIDFSLLEPMGVTLSSLPLDPVNSVRGGLYYTYSVFNGKWKLTARIESERYGSIARGDGGIDQVLYEIGSTSKLEPSLVR
jgi:prepilin-type N-terminal cleavage/methylation domain-containing protein